MMRSWSVALAWSVAALLLVVWADPRPTGAGEPAPQKGKLRTRLKEAVKKASGAWTLDEAREQLRLYPKDAYLQYVALQLARRENRLDEVGQEVEQLQGNDQRTQAMQRRRSVDLFSIFTGALAVQESLQLDTMRGGRRQARVAAAPRTTFEKGVPVTQAVKTDPQAEEKRRKEKVAVASLKGPTVKSHPWEQMLGDKKPEISPLAHYVPEDFYFAEFHSLNKLLQLMDTSDVWGTHLFNQAAQEARSQAVGERLRAQLCVETNRLLRPFYDQVVEEAAVTGSDLFLREGSDVTLIFKLKQPALFTPRMEGFLANAEKRRTDCKRQTGQCRGVDYVHLATPDRAVHVFSAYPQPDLHVRTNSLPALERVLDCIDGKKADGQPAKRLGDTKEFAYVRTLFPRGAREEDGFVYLSDPFIRRLVGPEVKLTESRRMECYNHLRMIGHAALLYRTEHGKAPDSLETLAQANCTPGPFNQGELVCPDGGRYTLSSDGVSGVCSHHGHAEFLKPCLEIPATQVTGEEADDYKFFLDDYNQYWRQYFDPIALRVQVTPERYRIETIVLPLIDNSIYTALATTLGGKPESLDTLPVPKRNIFSLGLRFNKETLLSALGPDEPIAQAQPTPPRPVDSASNRMRCANNLKQIALALMTYHDANGSFPPVANFDKQGKALLSWRVHILPYIEQDELYKQFHLNEPWDSEHNKKLVARLPAVYRCPNQKAAGSGLTTYLAVVGKQAVFTGAAKGIRISDITDGTSNTIMVVDANDERAVPWTRPDDWKLDDKASTAGLAGHHDGGFNVAMCDGSVRFIRSDVAPETLRPLFTRNGGEVVPDIGQVDTASTGPGRFLMIPGALFQELRLKEFLAKGIGNQVGLHVYDSVPLFDLNVPHALGELLGSFSGRSMFRQDNWEGLAIGFVVTSVNAPVYVSIPVSDAKVVDDFLARLDGFITHTIRDQPNRRIMNDFRDDFYTYTIGGGIKVRAFAVAFGPIKWRVFWARIGNGFYIASKPFILEDLAAAGSGAPADPGPAGHALVRLRPQNWERVLPDYRLSWAENDRLACEQNVGPLAGVGRALHQHGGEIGRDAMQLAERVYGTHFFCPEHGTYSMDADGKHARCSVHGNAGEPKQQAAPSDLSPASRFAREFAGMTVSFSFLEDGLHAVVTIDHK